MVAVVAAPDARLALTSMAVFRIRIEDTNAAMLVESPYHGACAMNVEAGRGTLLYRLASVKPGQA